MVVDTLERIAKEMEYVAKEAMGYPTYSPTASHLLKKYSVRLLALCDEAEKTDLVQALRTPINYVTYLGDAATIANQVRAKIADELATWLAANGWK